MVNSCLIIDNQQDFCNPKGSLYVPGAYNSNLNLADWFETNFSKINKVYVSLDCHSPKHISFAKNWVDKDGNSPKPFTKVRKSDKYKYKYSFNRPFSYEEIDVWPVHCVNHSWGAALTKELSILLEWHDNVYFAEKGKINFLEEYSVANKFLNVMKKGELIIVAGQASNICVYSTICSLIYQGYYQGNSFVILKDCMNEVKDYHLTQNDFFKFITDSGGLVTTTKEFNL